MFDGYIRGRCEILILDFNVGKKKSIGFCEIVIADYCKEWIDTNLIGSFVSFDRGLLESTLDFAEWYFYEMF